MDNNSKMKCAYCDLMERKEGLVYADDDIIAVVKEEAVCSGEIVVFPRQHLTILEMVSENLLEKCVHVANKVGMAVFESLGAQGTNILVRNGLGAGQSVPHFALEVIPRHENDELLLNWESQPAGEEEIETTFAMFKAEERTTGKEKEVEETIEGDSSKKETTVEDVQEEINESADDVKVEPADKIANDEPKEDTSNYLVKMRRRIP